MATRHRVARCDHFTSAPRQALRIPSANPTTRRRSAAREPMRRMGGVEASSASSASRFSQTFFGGGYGGSACDRSSRRDPGLPNGKNSKHPTHPTHPSPSMKLKGFRGVMSASKRRVGDERGGRRWPSGARGSSGPAIYIYISMAND
jgi:hypothetical protein